MLFFLSILGALIALSGMAMAHFRISSPALGFGIFSFGLLLLTLLFFPALIKLCRKGIGGTSSTALLFGLPALGLLIYVFVMAFQHPINDLTTDLENPPQFTHRTIEFPIPEEDKLLLDDSFVVDKSYNKAKSAVQIQKYQDLTFFDAKAPLEKVIPIMADRLKEQLPGWKIVVNDPIKGRIEAEVESKLFRFVDDVVVEVRRGSDPFDSQVHMRSKSRIGESDLGANYKRLMDLKVRLMLAVAPAVTEDAKRREAVLSAAQEKIRLMTEEEARKKQELEAIVNEGSKFIPPPPEPLKPAVPLVAPPSPRERK